MLRTGHAFGFLNAKSNLAHGFEWVRGVDQFLFKFKQLTITELFQQNIYSANYLVASLDFDFDIVVRRFAHYPGCFFYSDHFAVTQLIIELKNLIVAIYFNPAAYKIVWDVKLKLDLRNQHLD